MEVLLLALLGRKRKLYRVSSRNSKEQCGVGLGEFLLNLGKKKKKLSQIYKIRCGLNELNNFILFYPSHLYTLVGQKLKPCREVKTDN